MRKVLVTGAGGFIGHHLVNSLKSKGFHVIGIDVKRPEFEPSAADRFLIHDLTKAHPALEEVFDGVEDVWALAADMGGMGFISRNHGAIMRDNVTINIHTLEAARKARVKRYLYTSSACVYPEHLQAVAGAEPLSEPMAYPANPQDGYGWEKLYTEKLCRYYHEECGLDVRIVRFHNIYGPLGTWQGGREKAPAAICRRVAVAVQTGRDFIEIWGDGEQTRSFCHIEDCIQGLHRVMESGHNGPLNLGRDEMVSINGLADIVMDVAGVKLRKTHVPGPQGVRGRNSDNSLCRKIIGWAPEIPLYEGMEKTYRWIYDQVHRQTELSLDSQRRVAGSVL